VGSAIGFVHGSLLGYLGRPAGVSRGRALRRIVLGAFYCIPILVVGWALAMVLAVSATSYLSGRYVTFAATLVGWAGAAGLWVWAWVEGRRAWSHLYARWPDARALAVTVGLAAAVLLPVFLVARPEIWVLGVEPTTTAAVGMAAAASAWIVGPTAALMLLGIRALRRPSSVRLDEVSDG
jgi:hypothetical protein